MKKTREKNKKRDINNIRIIVIAILFLLVLTAIYFLYLRFVPEITIPYEGIGISGKEITETLLSEKEGENIEGIKIEEQSLVYKKLNTYYIGQTRKQKLNINLPIYINKNIAVFNIAQGVKLITNKYEEKDGYPNTTITGGMLYNIQNLEKTAIKEYQIPLNSIIYFTEEQISYYKIEGDIFKYEKITQIDKDTKVEIGEEITYEELLKKLKIIETEKPQEEIILEEQPQEEVKEEKEEVKEENKEEIIVEEPIQEPVEEEPEEEQEEKPEETEEQTQPEQNQDVEIKYQKPQVTCEEFTAKVYSMSTTLMIQDPSGTIKTPIQFIFKKNVSIGSSHKLDKNNSGLPLYPISKLAE